MQEAPHSSHHAVICGTEAFMVCSHRAGTGAGTIIMSKFHTTVPVEHLLGHLHAD